MDKALTPELQQYYEEQFSLFASKGWQDLLQDFEALKQQVKDLSTVNDSNDLWYRKGQLDILDLLIKRKESCERVYKELTDEADV